MMKFLFYFVLKPDTICIKKRFVSINKKRCNRPFLSINMIFKLLKMIKKVSQIFIVKKFLDMAIGREVVSFWCQILKNVLYTKFS